MTSPALELQEKMVAVLKADAGVTALVDQRVFDRVPAKADYPLVTIGEFEELSDDADCSTAYKITATLHCWSRAPGKPEASRLADAVRRALASLDAAPLTDNALVSFTHRQTRIFADADPLTTHAVLTFTALVETP